MNKLTYQDAIELKEHRLPQDPTYPRQGMRPPYVEIIWNDKDPFTNEENWRQVVTTRKDLEEKLVAKIPTLEELIEACGEITIKLWVLPSKKAGVQLADQSLDDVIYYDSPIQAVKNLYCALNPKKPQN